MRKFFNFLNNLGNANMGLLTILILIVGILAIIPFNKIGIPFSISFFDKVFTILSYNIKIPIFILLLITIAFFIYFLKIRRRYKTRPISIKFLTGSWRNEWHGDGFNGSQISNITKDGDYILGGIVAFKITDFEYDPKISQIKFKKIGLRAEDQRILINTLKLENNDLLIGTEDFYNIKYTRLSN